METLHRYCQIVGKVRMEYSPNRNHWWHVTLYVTTRDLTSGPIPYGRTTFDISFNLLENRLAVTTGEGGAFTFALDDLSVAEFYRRLFEELGSLGILYTSNKCAHANCGSCKIARYPRAITTTALL